MDNIRILLLGSSRFAIPALRELAFFKLLAAVAIPCHCDEMIENTEGVLAGSGIPLIKLEKKLFSQQLYKAIQEYKITLGLVMSFSYKIPSSVYNLPPKGFYNVHPGPLPQYRGADPVFQQLKNKEKYAGVTIHKLDEGIDTGPVVMLEMLKVEGSDTYGFLTTKLAHLAAKMTGIMIKLGSMDIAIPSRIQDESKARYFKKQQAKDIIIDWQTMSADSIIALINACNPWNKGAVAKINNGIMRLLEAEKFTGEQSRYKEPGYVVSIEETGMVITTFNNEAIKVRMVYTEEGFFGANYLSRLGIMPGNRFDFI